MNFVESVKTCLGKYATFEGRATRSEFWWFFLFQIIVSIVASLLDGVLFPPAMAQEVAGQMMTPEQSDMAQVAFASGPTPILNSIASIALLCPGLAATTRRLHDVGKSGWMQLIALTLIGIIPLIYWMTQKGDEAENKFGQPTA